MFTLEDNKPCLWQWDTKQYIKLDADAPYVHFKAESQTAVAVKVEDGKARIPDELLQKAGTLLCYLYDGAATLRRGYIEVNARPKPPGYVTTPTETLTWEILDERITTLEQEGTGQPGITPTIGENGNWYLGAEDTGKPSRGEKGEAGPQGPKGADGTMTFEDLTEEQKESLKGAPGPQGPKGDTGATGPEGPVGPKGATGEDGITPTIGENGNWYLGAEDTGKPSRGEKGEAATIEPGSVTPELLDRAYATLNDADKVTPEQASASIVKKTASFTLGLADAGTWIYSSGTAAVTITVPTHTAVPIPIGTEIEFCQFDTGSVTFAAASGVTLVSLDDKKKIAGRYGCAALKKTATNTWVLAGALA